MKSYFEWLPKFIKVCSQSLIGGVGCEPFRDILKPRHFEEAIDDAAIQQPPLNRSQPLTPHTSGLPRFARNDGKRDTVGCAMRTDQR
jgi:hypothetical protein